MAFRKKLIEVALPLDAINKASAREKSIRHGHPSTLHLWWARRPLAAARAVIFAQMVDDPASWPEEFPTEAAQEAERRRLFRLIEQLVLWENTTNEDLLEQARNEIRRSWRRTCAEHRDHPQAAELFDPERLPAFHDPFAGGGSLPLEAQRLGLEAHASDLNPVAVLINKAMIEIPPKFAGMPPVNPEARAQMARDRELGMEREWKGARRVGRGRALLRQVDARRSREAHRAPVSESGSDGGDGQGAARLEALRGAEAHGDRLAVGKDGEEPESGVSGRGCAVGDDVHVLSTKKGREAYVRSCRGWPGSYRFDVKRWQAAGRWFRARNEAGARHEFPLPDVGHAHPRRLHQDPRSGEAVGCSPYGCSCGRRPRPTISCRPQARMRTAACIGREPRMADPKVMCPTRLTGGTCVPYGLTTWSDLFT